MELERDQITSDPRRFPGTETWSLAPFYQGGREAEQNWTQLDTIHEESILLWWLSMETYPDTYIHTLTHALLLKDVESVGGCLGTVGLGGETKLTG